MTDFERLNLVWEVKRWVVPSNKNYRDQKKTKKTTTKKREKKMRKNVTITVVTKKGTFQKNCRLRSNGPGSIEKKCKNIAFRDLEDFDILSVKFEFNN